MQHASFSYDALAIAVSFTWMMRLHRDSEIKNKVQRLHTNDGNERINGSSSTIIIIKLQAHSPKWTGKNVRNV